MTYRARPGLVALYDIQPGNGAGQILQPQSPHGSCKLKLQGTLHNSRLLTVAHTANNCT